MIYGDVSPGDIRAVFHHRAPEGGHLPEADSHRLAAPFGNPGPVPLEVATVRLRQVLSGVSSSSRLAWPSPSSSMRSTSRTSSGVAVVTSARSSGRRPYGARFRRHKSSACGPSRDRLRRGRRAGAAREPGRRLCGSLPRPCARVQCRGRWSRQRPTGETPPCARSATSRIEPPSAWACTEISMHL